MSKICRKCGAPMNDDASFCTNCGATAYVNDNRANNQANSQQQRQQYNQPNGQQQRQQYYQSNGQYQNEQYRQSNGQYPNEQYRQQNSQYQNQQYRQPNGQYPNQQYNQPNGQQQNWQYNQMSGQYQNGPYNQPQYRQPAPKKKMSTGAVAGICIAAIVGVLVLFLFIVAIVSSAKGGKYATSSVPYTSGTLDGSTYTNEWANLRYNVPADFYAYDGVDSSVLLNIDTEENIDSGFTIYKYDENNNPIMMYVVFVDLESQSINYDEELFLDAEILSMTGSSNWSAFDIYKPDSYTSTEIAGRSYTTAHINMYYESYYSYTCSIYALRIDDKMVEIIVWGSSESENNSMVSQFEQYSSGV